MIGVVGDVKHRRLSEPRQAQVYTAHYQDPSTTTFCQFISKIQDSKFTMVFSEPGKPFVCAVINGDTIDTSHQ